MTKRTAKVTGYEQGNFWVDFYSDGKFIRAKSFPVHFPGLLMTENGEPDFRNSQRTYKRAVKDAKDKRDEFIGRWIKGDINL